jgi:hypothetical protein
MKHYSPTGRRNSGRPLKRHLDTWDRNGSTSGLTPWQTYDDDDIQSEPKVGIYMLDATLYTVHLLLAQSACCKIYHPKRPYTESVKASCKWHGCLMQISACLLGSNLNVHTKPEILRSSWHIIDIINECLLCRSAPVLVEVWHGCQ